MMELLGSLGIVVVLGYILFKFKSTNRIAEIVELRKDDLTKARRQAEVAKDIETIKKELAEKETGLKNMTPAQIEEYWKKNS